MTHVGRLSSAIFAGALSMATLRPPCAAARDDVPEEIAKQTNHVTHLTPRDIRYYKKQFKTKCARCHGLDGSGGGEEAAAQQVPPADFTDAEYMSTRTDGQLFYQVLLGGGEGCAMPAFGPESDHGWGENKIWYMVAFVRLLGEAPAE